VLVAESRLASGCERFADGLVHLVGLIGATTGLAWLLTRLGPDTSAREMLALAVYAAGLIGMLTVSGLYNLAPPGRMKTGLRRLDHGMIYVMIAGSYTPFGLIALRPALGLPLCLMIWLLALGGIVSKLCRPVRNELISLALYLGLGWLALPLAPALYRALPASTLLILLAGGAAYSLGSIVYVRCRMPFHSAAWHAIIVFAAGLHLTAVAQVLLART